MTNGRSGFDDNGTVNSWRKRWSDLECSIGLKATVSSVEKQEQAEKDVWHRGILAD
jgi:hypothetical protein